MPVSYEVFMKHAEKVTKNAPEVRPVLKGVKHLENGDAVVTDSHRLYVAQNIHTRVDGLVLTPTGKKIDDAFPDLSRLIPDPFSANQKIQLEVSELLKAADMIASVGTVIDGKGGALEFKEDVIQYLSPFVKVKYSFYPNRFEEPICANANYLLDAMKLFNAVGCKAVTLNFYGRLRPFTLVNEDEDLIVLILPIRKY
jgi:DNA polymerase III sliding clamp (beta) subunit (PCNA family)